MKKIDIFFINNPKILESNPNLEKIYSKKGEIKLLNIILKINIFNLSNYEIVRDISKITNITNFYKQIKIINIIFDNKINKLTKNMIITKLSDILYEYYPVTKEIRLYQVNNESKTAYQIDNTLMDELTKYKNIVMDPNKNPDTYLNFIKSNVPTNYDFTFKTLTDDKIFPLTFGVGLGSTFNSYFVQISPNNPNPNNLDVFLVGKSVTYDSGGLNIKIRDMEEMKIDMTGSAIILSTLRLLSGDNLDSNLNIYLLIPIVENMISSKAIKPGSVIETMSEKKVEIINTDAEGRLCIVDCIDWINKKLITKPSKSLIIDIATLTGNVFYITSGKSSIIMSNDIGIKYADKIINIGEKIGEHLDYLKIRPEYEELLQSPVADIQNINKTIKAGCMMGGTFIHYFTDKTIPWIHIDLGDITFTNSMSQSYGINLLYEFCKHLNENS
jgi:leucyl aminopeptidase